MNKRIANKFIKKDICPSCKSKGFDVRWFDELACKNCGKVVFRLNMKIGK